MNDLAFATKVFQAARPPRLRSMREFAEQEIVIPSGPYEGRRFRVERQPFVGPLFDAIDSGMWRRHVITGPSQSGKTLSAFIIPVLYHLFEIGEDVICATPTATIGGDKWQHDILPAIRASRFRDLLPTSGQGSQGGTPTAVRFANGATLLFMSGGGGDKSRSHATTRVLVVTETDGLDEPGASSREGDKISQLEARTRSFGDRAVIYLECTVSTEDGRTWQEYQRGTTSKLIVQCPHCNAWVTPEREHLVGWERAVDKMVAGRRARFACPACGVHLSEAERQQMNQTVRLMHRDQQVTDRGAIVGIPAETDTLGFRWNAFNNQFVSTELLGQQEWSVQIAEHAEVEDRVLRQFFWAVPAESQAIRESLSLTKVAVRGEDPRFAGRLIGIPRGIVPPNTERLTLFCDIGWSTLNETTFWEVVAHRTLKRRHVVDYGSFTVRSPSVTAEGYVASNLRTLRDAISATQYRDAEGTEYPLALALVDAGTMTDVILAFVAESGGCWRASKGLGLDEPAKQRFAMPSPDRKDVHIPAHVDHWYLHEVGSLAVVNFDPDHWKHRVHDTFAIPPDEQSPLSDSVTLFGDSPREHVLFSNHLLAEVWESTFEPGRGERKRWNPRERGNHLFDCEVGNMVAGSVSAAELYPRPKAISLAEIQRQNRANRHLM